MATQSRRKTAALDQRLRQEPWRFEFFQAVRLLELMDRERKPVGGDAPPAQEAVRFRSRLARSFPPAPVAGIGTGDGESEAASPPEMQVTFMGLTGPAGVLPEGYLDLLFQRQRQHDPALKDFLDLFNHRLISLFYKAWEKHRIQIGFERARRAFGSRDPFSGCLECLVGIGTDKQKERLPYSSDLPLRYAGHFSRYPRSAAVLESLLADYLRTPVEIAQLVGRWLPLETAERTRLPSPEQPDGHFNRLGANTVIGTRVWDVKSHFRIGLGPLTRRQFSELLPGGVRLRQLRSLVALWCGPELDFELRLTLRATEVPQTRLGGRDGFPSRLGWSSWLCGRTPRRDRDDTRISHSAISAKVPYTT